MAGFVGYRASRLAGGGLYNGYATPKRKQDWSDGETVRVGFLTLEVVAKVGADYRLWNPLNGKQYTFTPHMGLNAGWDA
jgi:hypothetical protein